MSAWSSSPLPWDARRRALVWELTKREIAGRYRGASLGVFWSLLQPFLMLGVYTVAFGQVLGSRWPGATGTADFALILFVGLIVHGFLAECVSKAPSLIVGNANFVKRVVFPLETLGWPVVLSAAFHFFTNAVVLVVFLLAVGRPVGPGLLLLPIIMLPFALMCLGTVWGLAALSVYFRDVQQLVGPVITAMLFLSSAIVPPSAVPEAYRLVFQLNPLTPIIDAARAVAIEGVAPDWRLLGLFSVIALAVFFAGFALFSRLRRGFADVL